MRFKILITFKLERSKKVFKPIVFKHKIVPTFLIEKLALKTKYYFYFNKVAEQIGF